MSFARFASLPCSLLALSLLAVACGGNVASSGAGKGGGQDPTADAESGASDTDAGTTADDGTDAGPAAEGSLVGDASPPPPTCPTNGGRIVSCDYPGHAGKRSPEVSSADIIACGFSDCGAYCQAANADSGLSGVRCTTEEGTAKMYCTCLNP